jgi:putative ATP-dependent endonuclease of OLD family
MACELILLAQEDHENKLLLIEEPEAHLMAQRQLRVMKFMQQQAKEQDIQIIVTTHSPNLASALSLNNIVLVRKARAFSMAEGETELEASDYRFLERFLDVTKANLFFARGVMIVEGDSENILLPTLARLIGRDFTEHGVSIVNVGGVGLRRYARIFQRKNSPQLDIPVACVTDTDVMPNCAPTILEKLSKGDDWPTTSRRQWRAKKDFNDENPLSTHRSEKAAKASGQCVQTFISDEWTLEYDLALGPKDQNDAFPGGLADDVFVAACLANNDDALNSKRITIEDVVTAALGEFSVLKAGAEATDDCVVEEIVATQVYAKFARDGVSKAIAAQYLAERLQTKHTSGEITSDDLRERLPRYLTKAIDFVTAEAGGSVVRGESGNE